VTLGVIRLQAQGFPQASQGFLFASRLRQGDTKVVLCRRRVGSSRDRLMQERQRFHKAASLRQRDAEVEEGLGVAWPQ
jgi:hypothetical protein